MNKVKGFKRFYVSMAVSIIGISGTLAVFISVPTQALSLPGIVGGLLSPIISPKQLEQPAQTTAPTKVTAPTSPALAPAQAPQTIRPSISEQQVEQSAQAESQVQSSVDISLNQNGISGVADTSEKVRQLAISQSIHAGSTINYMSSRISSDERNQLYKVSSMIAGLGVLLYAASYARTRRWIYRSLVSPPASTAH